MNLSRPRFSSPSRKHTEDQARSEDSNVGLHSKCIGKAYQQTNKRTRNCWVQSERDVSSKKADGKAAEKCLQEHCERFVWVLAEDHHRCVEQAEHNAAQNAQNDAVHGTACTSLTTDSQVPTAKELFIFLASLYAQISYLFAIEHKLEARWAAVRVALPIGSHGDRILPLVTFFAVIRPWAPMNSRTLQPWMASWPATAPPGINHHALLWEKTKKVFV
jgi:hypothetical protein